VACRDSAVAVTVNIEPTTAPLRAGLDTLLANKSRYYNETGLYNALNQSNLTIAWLAINEGVARIEFTGSVVFSGECDALRIQAQLEAIAKQYYTVKDTEILVNGIALETLLGLQPEGEPTELPIPTVGVTIQAGG